MAIDPVFFVQKERELTSDCFSLSIRRRLGPVLSLVASSSWIAAQTLRGSHRHCWSLALVADDRRSGLEMLAGFNHVVSDVVQKSMAMTQC